MGHQVLSGVFEGKNIMLSLDCKTCHKVDEKSIGPSFTDVAKRYAKDPEMVSKLMGENSQGRQRQLGRSSDACAPGFKRRGSPADHLMDTDVVRRGEKQNPSLPAGRWILPCIIL